MTEIETIEMNELISDFMGLNERNGYHTHPSPSRGFCRPIHLQYSYNYNWLIIAWRKFKDLKFSKETEVKLHLNYVTQLAVDLAYGAIEVFFNNLCIAIKWYNANKP